MKTIVTFLLILFSYQLQAAACKCNCNPMSNKMCASSYDIEHPCNDACTAQISPLVKALNESNK